jgi:SAM-dependent methyltransferase
VTVDSWRETNRAWWDERAPHHVASRFYDVDGFRAGRSDLRQFEVDELGDVAGKDLVHLQCHFGLDSMSWTRLGAHTTGLDFSQPAIDAANALAAELKLDAHFVMSDVYDAPKALGRTFDIVYTGIGALCWLPDIPRWAAVVRDLLRPGGVLYLVEVHPMSDVLGDEDMVVRYPYFHTEGITEDSPGSYATLDGPAYSRVTTTSWIHPLSRVMGSLIAAGLTIELFTEHPYTAFARWPFMTRDDQGRYWLPEDAPTLPLLYSLRARRSA